MKNVEVNETYWHLTKKSDALPCIYVDIKELTAEEKRTETKQQTAFARNVRGFERVKSTHEDVCEFLQESSYDEVLRVDEGLKEFAEFSFVYEDGEIEKAGNMTR